MHIESVMGGQRTRLLYKSILWLKDKVRYSVAYCVNGTKRMRKLSDPGTVIRRMTVPQVQPALIL